MKEMLIVAIVAIGCMFVIAYLICRIMNKEKRMRSKGVRFILVSEIVIAIVAISTLVIRTYLNSIGLLRATIGISFVGCLLMMIIVIVSYKNLLIINNKDNDS